MMPTLPVPSPSLNVMQVRSSLSTFLLASHCSHSPTALCVFLFFFVFLYLSIGNNKVLRFTLSLFFLFFFSFFFFFSLQRSLLFIFSSCCCCCCRSSISPLPVPPKKKPPQIKKPGSSI
ncbi:hypothetical protein QBC44DRAFT_62765 [Cladorrhinum sp. PSN332]|nr:hypothetical protein QBC44DRAFT_62765 [Cladorrhinum sp. PSN332]